MVAQRLKIWYNHEMGRRLRIIGTWILIVLAIALYREWTLRHSPPLFLPLGFFESAVPVVSPETNAQRPEAWKEPLTPVVMDDAVLLALARESGAQESTVDVLVVGDTLGASAAALAASDGGAATALLAGRDLRAGITAHAGILLSERPPPISPSPFEASLRFFLSQRGQSVMPGDVATYVTDALKSRGVSLLDGFAIAGVARAETGQFHRLLARKNDGSSTVLVRFSSVIDGTDDGAFFARAGIPTVAGWDTAEATGEPGALPTDVADALARGYTMSGRTIAGMGKRLDGALVQLGILDRGYHGAFVAPTRLDPCWKPIPNARPFIRNGAVVRPASLGCGASFDVSSPFDDTVEIFYVNHGNETVSATVRAGSGAGVSIVARAEPTSPFIRIGAFPLLASSPLTIDVRSTLPIDRLEGLVVRKANTNVAAKPTTIERNREIVLRVQPWTSTLYDVYVRTADQSTPVTLIVDGRRIPTTIVGDATFAALSVPLAAGDRPLRIAERDVGGTVWAIPVAPNLSGLDLSPAPESWTASGSHRSRRWSFVAETDGPILLAAPRRTCATSCSVRVTAAGDGKPLADRSAREAGTIPSETLVLDTINVRRGVTYDVAFTDESAGNGQPMPIPLLQRAALHAIADELVTIDPPVPAVYDVWVKSARSQTVVVAFGDAERTVDALARWTYVGTTLLSNRMLSARGGGTVELLAVPNLRVDTYVTSLAPGGTLPIGAGDFPPGSYELSAFGIEPPRTITIVHARGGSTTHLSLDGDAGRFDGERPVAQDAAGIALSSPAEYPQRIVLREEPSVTVPVPGPKDGSIAVLRDDSPAALAANASGSMLFTPLPAGLGPVTAGSLGSSSLEAYATDVVNASYARLRFGDVRVDCSADADPTCDGRRFVRAPDILGTRDARSPSVVVTDGRRIVGRAALTASGAFAVRSGCGSACSATCLAGSIREERCIDAASATPRFAGAIVAVRGTAALPDISSPAERSAGTLRSLLRSFARDHRRMPVPTYLETMPEARDFSLPLDVLIPAGETNVLVANGTASATHMASRALRSMSTDMAIGSAVGYAAAFAAVREHASPAFIADSPDALARLQRHLVDRGVMVVPTFGLEDDRLLLKSVQRRILDGVALLEPRWTDDRLTFRVDPAPDDDESELRSAVFGTRPVYTVAQALKALPGAPESDVQLLSFGIKNGFIPQKVLRLSLREILQQAVDATYLLKAEYLLKTGGERP